MAWPQGNLAISFKRIARSSNGPPLRSSVRPAIILGTGTIRTVFTTVEPQAEAGQRQIIDAENIGRQINGRDSRRNLSGTIRLH